MRIIKEIIIHCSATKEDKDYSKLNRKRAASKKSPIKPDYLLEWK